MPCLKLGCTHLATRMFLEEAVGSPGDRVGDECFPELLGDLILVHTGAHTLAVPLKNMTSLSVNTGITCMCTWARTRLLFQFRDHVFDPQPGSDSSWSVVRIISELVNCLL